MAEATTLTISPEFRQRLRRTFRRALIPILVASGCLLCVDGVFFIDSAIDFAAMSSQPPIADLVTQTRIVAEQKGLQATYETAGDIYPFIRRDVERIQRGTFALGVGLHDPEKNAGVPGGGTSWLAKKDKESAYFVSAAHVFYSKDGQDRPLKLTAVTASRPNVTPDKFSSNQVIYEVVPNTDIAVTRVWLAPEDLSKIKDGDVLGFNPRPEIDTRFDKLLTVGFLSKLRSESQPSGFITSVQALIPLEEPNNGKINLEGVTLNGASGSPVVQLGQNRRLLVVAVLTDISSDVKRESFFERTRQDITIGRTLGSLGFTIERLSKAPRPTP